MRLSRFYRENGPYSSDRRYTVTRLWVRQMTDRGSIRGRSNRLFSSPKGPEGLWGPPSLRSAGIEGLWGPPSLHSAGIEGFFLDVKRPGREADYSLPSSTEVKNDWNYTFTSPHAFTTCTTALPLFGHRKWSKSDSSNRQTRIGREPYGWNDEVKNGRTGT